MIAFLALLTVVLVLTALVYDYFFRFGRRFDGLAFLSATGPRVYLTFDDGPASALGGWSDSLATQAAQRAAILAIDPDWDFEATPTCNLARTLADFGVRAMFFVRGDVLQADANARDTVGWLAGRGHVIGNHSFAHAHAREVSVSESLRQLREAHALISACVGAAPRVFRPPYGDWHIRNTLGLWRDPVLRHYGLPVGWTHCTFDWSRGAPDLASEAIDREVDAVLAALRASPSPMVLLQHDVWIYTALFTRRMLVRLREDPANGVADPLELQQHVTRVGEAARHTWGWGYYLKARLGLLRKRLGSISARHKP